jgi:hypothetical protein
MAHRERRSELDPGKVNSFVPAVRNADANGVSGNLQGYDSAMFDLNVGAEGDTLTGAVYLDVFFEESSDDSVFTTVAAADLLGPAALGADIAGAIRFDAVAEAPANHTVAYRGKKQYIRARLDFVGTHTVGTPLAVTIWRTHKTEINR